ncbi:MAG TPA: protein kinase [Pseudonocardia sp.]
MWFGPYRLVEIIGRGGMGIVYRAFDSRHDREVALKVLPEDLSSDPVFRARFQQEARTAAKIEHPHVVPIYDFGEIDGRTYLTMRLIKGQNLDHLIRAAGKLTPPRAAAVLAQVASALDAAHGAGLIHRDVKPANVIVTPPAQHTAEFAYLMDFGIARAVDASTRTALTATNVALGTPHYMAPERFLNEGIDHRADIYSLGCVLFETLTGRRPFPDDAIGTIMLAHLHTEPPRPSALVENLPTGLDDIVSRAMAKTPSTRYRSAGELAAAVTAAIARPPKTEASTPTWPRTEPTSPVGPTRIRGTVPATRHHDPSAAGRPAPEHPAATLIAVGNPTTTAGTPIPSPRRPSKPARSLLIVMVALAVVALLVGGIHSLTTHTNSAPTNSAPTNSAPTASPPTNSPPAPAADPIMAKIDVGRQPGRVALNSAGQAAYVTNYAAGTVSVINTATNAVTTTIAVGSQPAQVVVTGDRAYVTNRGSNSVTVLDTGSNTALHTIPVGTAPTGIALSPDGRTAYVADSGAGTISIVDLATNTVARAVSAGNGPSALAVTPDGRRIYVADQGGSGQVTVLDASTGTTLTTIQVGKIPGSVTISPDGGRAYVTDFGSGTVTVIATATNSVAVSIPIGASPAAAALTPDGTRLYVSNQGSDNIVVIDTATGTIERKLSLPGPNGIALTPDATRAYVVNTSSDTVTALRLR